MKRLLLFFALLSVKSALACTGFGLCLDGNLVFARNTDMGFSQVSIVRNEAGIARKAYVVKPKQEPLEWISKYRSLTFNHVGIGFPNEGMNEAGLVVAPFTLLPDRKYPYNEYGLYVNEWQWIQYHLDQHATVQEVVASIKRLNISRMVPNTIQLLVCDRQECIVIEPNENTYEVHNITEFPVIANDRYSDMMKSYRELSWNEIISGYMSGARFLFPARAIMKRFEWPAEEGRAYAFETLGGNVAQEITDFQTVYEPSTGAIHVRRLHKDSATLRIPVLGPPGSFEMPKIIPAGLVPEFKVGEPVFHCELLLSNMGHSGETIRDVKSLIER